MSLRDMSRLLVVTVKLKLIVSHPLPQPTHNMHPCLMVQEILANIFASYSYSYTGKASTSIKKYSRQDRRLLAHLARTCKAFSEPALDVLWHTQASIVPLVRCLPLNALEIDAKREILNIKRELVPSDFDRMMYYSPRIRAWDEGYTPWRINDMVLPMIWSRRDSLGPLLPMLKHIKSLSLDDFLHMCLYPHMIIGPSIRSIQITVNLEWTSFDENLEHPWDNLASVLKGVAASLAGFAVTTGNRVGPSLGCGNLVSLFRDFSSIQTLDIHRIDIDHTTFIHLTSLSHLESLNVAINATELTKFLARPPIMMDFPKLKELALQTDNLVNCTKLLKRGCFRSLRSLEIMRLIERGLWDLAPFFKSLQNHQSHTELHTLRILGDGYFSEDEEVPRVAKIIPSTIEPVLSFKNLADFQITLDSTFALNNEFLMKMGTTFSKLRIFHLFERSRRRAPKITLSGFLSFTAQCSELVEVTLRMDALKIPSFHTFGEIVPHSSLRNLNVATSPASQNTILVAILTEAFPNLSQFSYGWNYCDPQGESVAMPLTVMDKSYRNCWKDVRDTMHPVTRYH